MKRFDFANEVAKQLITISSAIIAVVVTFYDKFLSHENCTFVLVFLALLFFILSVLAGVLTIGGLTNLVELQEFEDAKKMEADDKAKSDTPAPAVPKAASKQFVRLGDSAAQVCAIAQQALFGLALFLFIGAAIYDRLSK